MTFDEILTQIRELLEREGRVSYRALKRRFGLDDEYVEDIKDELIDAKRVAVDEEGKVLIWVGDSSLESRVKSPEPEGQGRASPVQPLDPIVFGSIFAAPPENLYFSTNFATRKPYQL